jgi:lipopolysaccharide/colanic/teichoic acid biosynthesis glycosyltransferase
MYKSFFKRLIDLVMSFLGIVVLSPVILIITITLLIVNRDNPFFLQSRPGKNESVFKLIKFKTMTDRHDVNGDLLSDNERLTRIGNFIRKTSLDEIPQLINVLKGEMSLIGPRPLLVEYLPLYNKEQRKRHNVQPGITGWAQVNGRNAISWEDKFRFDIYYVEKISFSLDLKIVFLTIKKVLMSEDINSSNTVTMKKFSGSR